MKVIITPLDWGLGHATRCVPVIRALMDKGHEVFVASSGSALILLKQEFPTLQFFELPSYNPIYSSKSWLVGKLLSQVFKFFDAIKKEHRQIQHLINDHHFNLIISDHRYGCYAKNVKSIFITHQVSFLFSGFWKWGGWLVNRWHHAKMKNFHSIWIPDLADSFLSGGLSKSNLEMVTFIGPLSRFSVPVENSQKKYDLLVLISGPEPQRTIFESLVKKQLEKTTLRSLIVKGKPNGREELSTEGNVTEANHLSTAQLQQTIEQSEFILCRSGYSTVMDIAKLKKKNVIFVPTPGQPEQEYLAWKFKSEGIAHSVEQRDLAIEKDMKLARGFKGFSFSSSNDTLIKAIEKLGS